MENQKEQTLVEALKEATKKAFVNLFAQNPKEHFYYCTLVLIEAQGCPVVSAMSEEALDRVIKKYIEEYKVEDSPENLRQDLKWSYADSPYNLYGEQYFTKVQQIVEERDAKLQSDEYFEQEYEIRMNIMEKVMADLDQEGIFGSGEQRNRIVVAAEVMPPDDTNTSRVLRLNAKENLKEWLEEAAEELE